MLLSIIIPLYNAESYIAQCLDSILQQKIAPDIYEVIIVNDGSSDKSLGIVESYLGQNPNFKLISQNNQGQSVARNTGMSKACGEYIQFVDADDFLIPDSLSQIVRFAKADNVSAYDMITFGIKGGIPDSPGIKNDGHGECIWSGSGYDYVASHNYSDSQCYYWLNRTFAEKSNLKFEEGKLCEDAIFTLTAILSSKSIALMDSSVYFYARRPDSTSSPTNPERKRKYVEGFKYAINSFGQILEVHKNMGKACMERVITHRDRYFFFLLIRLLRLGAYDEAKNEIGCFREKGIYPIKHFIGKDYNGLKFRITAAIVNNCHLYLTLCKINFLKLKVCALFRFVRH